MYKITYNFSSQTFKVQKVPKHFYEHKAVCVEEDGSLYVIMPTKEKAIEIFNSYFTSTLNEAQRIVDYNKIALNNLHEISNHS